MVSPNAAPRRRWRSATVPGVVVTAATLGTTGLAFAYAAGTAPAGAGHAPSAATVAAEIAHEKSSIAHLHAFDHLDRGADRGRRGARGPLPASGSAGVRAVRPAARASPATAASSSATSAQRVGERRVGSFPVPHRRGIWYRPAPRARAATSGAGLGFDPCQPPPTSALPGRGDARPRPATPPPPTTAPSTPGDGDDRGDERISGQREWRRGTAVGRNGARHGHRGQRARGWMCRGCRGRKLAAGRALEIFP